MRPTVAILAGGLATRLRPITAQIPKALVEIDGRPFAEHQIRLLRTNGLTDIVFLIAYRGEMLVEALGDGRRYGVRLRYAFDGPRPLGTGGAIRRALPELGDPFFVLYGDSYLDCDYAAIECAFLACDKAGLMTVCRNDNRWDRSNVEFDGQRIIRYDKRSQAPGMQYIDYGLGVFRRSAFADRPEDDAFDLADVYQRLLAEDRLAGFEIPGRFYEIGSPSGLEETRAYLAGKGSADR
jgi:MurNAc alpha-1-phosphate uridylyltransferase